MPPAAVAQKQPQECHNMPCMLQASGDNQHLQPYRTAAGTLFGLSGWHKETLEELF